MARGRLRTRVNWAARWCGVPAVAVTLLLWLYSGARRIDLLYSTPAHALSVCVEQGSVTFDFGRAQWWMPSASPRLAVFRLPPQQRGYPSWRWLFDWKFTLQGRVYLQLPLWSVGVAASVISGGGWFWRRRRVVSNGICPSCNYDLSGLPPGSPCPECAASPPQH